MGSIHRKSLVSEGVPGAGLEPARLLRAAAFKAAVSAVPPPGRGFWTVLHRIGCHPPGKKPDGWNGPVLPGACRYRLGRHGIGQRRSDVRELLARLVQLTQ